MPARPRRLEIGHYCCLDKDHLDGNVTDRSMPSMDEPFFVKKTRKRHPRVPIFMVRSKWNCRGASVILRMTDGPSYPAIERPQAA